MLMISIMNSAAAMMSNKLLGFSEIRGRQFCRGETT